MKKANEKDKQLEKQQRTNEFMKFAVSAAMGLAVVMAYKKGYDDAKHKRKMRYGGSMNGKR